MKETIVRHSYRGSRFRVLPILLVVLLLFGCSGPRSSPQGPDEEAHSVSESLLASASAEPSSSPSPDPDSAQTPTPTPVPAPSPKPERPAMSATPEPVRKETGLPFSRGVNLGNCLEAPTEGAWGLVIQDDWLPVIREAGFDHIRLPVKWSGHAGRNAPYTLDEKILARVDHVIRTALDADLGVVLNVHHYDEMATDPLGHIDRLSGIWTQLADHYRDLPDQVAFELMNEPNKAADSVWPELSDRLYRQVRADAPDRWICVTNGNWSSATSLSGLTLTPAMLEDEKLFATFHFYEPFQFTHQHASWVAGSDAWGGTLWDGNMAQQAFITRQFDKVANWSAENGDIPVLMGEFGAYSACDPLSRERWTAFCAREAERRGFAWSYWEFASGFGIYSKNARRYDPVLLGSLIP